MSIEENIAKRIADLVVEASEVKALSEKYRKLCPEPSHFESAEQDISDAIALLTKAGSTLMEAT
jgi:hypothetical protein